MNLLAASRSVELLFAISLLIQTFEYIKLLDYTGEESVWSWQIQRADIPQSQAWVMHLLDRLLSHSSYKFLLWFRLLGALSLVVYGVSIWSAWFLLISNLLLLVRWRGAFNGGSDFMTLVVTCGLTLGQSCALVTGEAMGWVISLWYVSIHSITSYFMSGWVKLISREWISGVCMPVFLDSGVYGPLESNSFLAKRPVAIICSWSFILWEALMPLALIRTELAWVFCSIAVLFHFLVFLFFGLNRFFWAWLVSLPAILYSSTWVW
jgi:hypothetical protein